MEKDVFYQLVDALCKEKTERSDMEADRLIKKYATKEILNHQQSQSKETCLIAACRANRVTVVKAIIAKRPDLDLAENLLK